MSLTTQINLTASVRDTNSIDLGSSSANRQLSLALTLANGTGAGQADRKFVDTRTLAASATEDLDLAGSLTDAFGTTQVFARIKALIIQASASNTNTVQVSRPASNGWATLFAAASDQVNLRPGTLLAVVAGSADATGYAVTASTGDLLTITNGGAGTSVDYSIVIVGCSA